MKLSSTGKSALYIGGGLLLGLGIGALITNPSAALGYAPAWAVVFALLLGGVVLFLREKDAPPAPLSGALHAAPARANAAPAPRGSGGAALQLALVDVPAGYPTVLGEADAIRVRVAFLREGVPAEGAAVRLTASPRDGARAWSGEGLTGSDGIVSFAIPPQPRGDLLVQAEARLDAAAGSAGASVTIVRYEDEIERLFGEFRAYAAGIVPDAESSTARELADRLRNGAKPETAKALIELARIYELVAYGDRDADRRLYLALMAELLHLEHAELPSAARPAPGA